MLHSEILALRAATFSTSCFVYLYRLFQDLRIFSAERYTVTIPYTEVVDGLPNTWNYILCAATVMVIKTHVTLHK